MTSKQMDLAAFAQSLLNAPTTHSKLMILNDWNKSLDPQTAMEGFSSHIFWGRLKSLGLLDGLLKWAFLPPKTTDLGNAQDGFKLQAASMIAVSRLLNFFGVFGFMVEDTDIGAVIREYIPNSYGSSIGKIVDGILTDPGDLSYHRIASLYLLEPIFNWAKASQNLSLMQDIDRDYVLQLVYYVFFDPTAYHSGYPEEKIPKQDIMVRCDSILSGLNVVHQSSRSKSRTAEELIRVHGVSKVIEWCRALFANEMHVHFAIIEASIQIVISLQQVERFQRSYAESDIPHHMITVAWKCVRNDSRLDPQRAKYIPIPIMFLFAQSQAFTLNPRSAQFYRPRLTANHARDVILLFGRAVMNMTARTPLGDALDVIQRYIRERHIDDVEEPQLTSIIIDSMDLVLSSLHIAMKSGAISMEMGNWAVGTWKDFICKTFNLQMEGYSPWKRRINPNAKRPYNICSWYRCPLYSTQSGNVLRQLLVCAGCQMTPYCSIECQRSDWREGQHGKTCKRPPTRP